MKDMRASKKPNAIDENIQQKKYILVAVHRSRRRVYDVRNFIECFTEKGMSGRDKICRCGSAGCCILQRSMEKESSIFVRSMD